jgi:hypothetical protein
MSKQQKTTSNLQKSERITLSASVAVIILSFILIGTPYFTLSWAFLLIVMVDLIVLMGNAQSETVKRLVLFLSVTAAFFAALFAASAYFPWLFH